MTVAPTSSGSGDTMEPFESLGRWLTRSWFVIWPPFTLLVGWTIYERTCVAQAEPWPWLLGRPWLALFVGAVYVSAHGWCVAWYLNGRAAQPFAGAWPVSIANRPNRAQVALMLLLLAIEYAPRTLWRVLMRSIEC